MTNPPYSPGRHGPTLLYIFQTYVSEGASPEAAAACLADETETGKIETNPALKPGAQLEPKQGERRPRLVDDVRLVDGVTERIRTPSKTEFCYGPPRLDVVDVDGTRTGAENFSACRCATILRPPDPYVSPKPGKKPSSARKPVAAKPTYRQQRDATKVKKAKRTAQQEKFENDVFKLLKDRKPKVRSRKVCENICKVDHKLGPGPARRIWDRLCGRDPARPKSRKPASRRRTRAS